MKPERLTPYLVVLVALLSACQADQPSSEERSERPASTTTIRHVSETPTGDIVAAEQVAEAVDEAAADLPSPPGGELRSPLVAPAEMDLATTESIAAFRLACQWFRYWLDGIAIGDDQAVIQATPVLFEVPTWPAVADMEGFWEMFLENVEEGVADGPQWFVAANCPDVRDELPVPTTPPIHNASAAVVLGPDDSPLVARDERSAAIGRLGAEVPLPPDHSFQMLVDAPHAQSEKALLGVLAHHAWCHWLSVLLNEPEQEDAVVEQLAWFADPSELPEAVYPQRLYVAEGIVDEEESRQFWVTVDYKLNCFGIDPALDERLASQ